jgi:hypothetical protein
MICLVCLLMERQLEHRRGRRPTHPQTFGPTLKRPGKLAKIDASGERIGDQAIEFRAVFHVQLIRCELIRLWLLPIEHCQIPSVLMVTEKHRAKSKEQRLLRHSRRSARLVISTAYSAGSPGNFMPRAEACV